MIEYIQLESEKYWAEVQARRNREDRLLRNRERRQKNAERGVLVAAALLLAVAWSCGAFQHLDVLGTVKRLVAWTRGYHA